VQLLERGLGGKEYILHCDIHDSSKVGIGVGQEGCVGAHFSDDLNTSFVVRKQAPSSKIARANESYGLGRAVLKLPELGVERRTGESSRILDDVERARVLTQNQIEILDALERRPAMVKADSYRYLARMRSRKAVKG
jgi:hypothetical protein